MNADARPLQHTVPLAVTAMVETLAADPMLANAMGGCGRMSP